MKVKENNCGTITPSPSHDFCTVTFKLLLIWETQIQQTYSRSSLNGPSRKRTAPLTAVFTKLVF